MRDYRGQKTVVAVGAAFEPRYIRFQRLLHDFYDFYGFYDFYDLNGFYGLNVFNDLNDFNVLNCLNDGQRTTYNGRRHVRHKM
jgi:hypothetical protein